MSETLQLLVADILAIDVGQVDDSLSQDTSESWDSLNHLRLITAIEEELGVSFTMGEIESTKSYKALRTLIASKRATVTQ